MYLIPHQVLGFIFIDSPFLLYRWLYEGLEESRHRRSVRHRWAVGQVGLGRVGRRENGTDRRSGQTGSVQGGHRYRSAVRHARAPATGSPVSAWHTMLPDDDNQQRQHNDDIQGRQLGRKQKVSARKFEMCNI